MHTLKVVILILIPYLLFGLAYLAYYYNKPKWFIRKLIHTFGLILVGIYGSFLNTLEEVLYVLTIFLIILVILSLIPQLQLFQSLIRMGTREGQSQIESVVNATLTSVSILALMIVAFFGSRHYFLAGVLSVALGDGLGEFIGKPYGKHKYKLITQKSVEGSFGVFIGTFIGSVIAFISFDINFLSVEILLIMLFVSIVATLIEAFSVSFIDNVIMPWAVAGLLWLLI
ncbi:MAG: hypothetical protein ACC656_00630 [Candidatus Heimdallarchaeota archaeon]